ncbi:CAZyme family AA3 [Penicillium argentinense]|uniref:CAZyme family AA3 n=1 Tax=Penicillium argentinense TaxID=1131581 RepID=A0A9W9JV39_9EURO|nr:CAZyme family AA3 [Penicillium argentinense]KAJ5082247.1 CAZyme family AA3 [Penicillium argentinense]
MIVFDTDSTDGLETSHFDFIIIGGGTSGLVVASRLSEDPSINVLVLEAGTNRLNDPRISVPALAISAFEDPDFDWNFKTTPQEQLNGREMLANKGRTLGGSSAINMGMVIYPSCSGMNAWEELGNPGWGWDGFSPYIRKFQKATPPSKESEEHFGDVGYKQEDQGSDGPVQVSFADHYMPYYGAWMKTFEMLGYPQADNPINGTGTGPFINPSAVDPVTHTRSHSAAAYLTAETRARPNLRVVTGALVKALLLEKGTDGVEASTVVFSKGQEVYSVSVGREVILAAGATQTPQILELSGIGDGELLQRHGIETVINNPYVGRNMQEHGIIPYSFEVADGLPSADMARDPDVAAAAMTSYEKDGSGPLGYIQFAAAFMPCVDLPQEQRNEMVESIKALIKNPETPRALQKQLEAQAKLLEIPEETTAQFILAPFQLNPREEIPKRAFGPSHPGNFISICTVLSYPLSRGSVHIGSNKAEHAPVIDVGTLSNPVDLELHARHCMWADRVAATEPFASLLKKGGYRLHSQEPVDLERAKELCKELVMSNYHFCGTCAMMPEEDGGVVDSRLKVYGTTNIRVVDASVFPLIPRGNIQATVFAVAEKAADIIKGDI